MRTVLLAALAATFMLAAPVAAKNTKPPTAQEKPAQTCAKVGPKTFNRWLKKRQSFTGKRPKFKRKPVCVRPHLRKVQADVRRFERTCNGGNPAANRCLARRMAAERGITGQQWECLDDLWGWINPKRALESGWDHTADNPHSDAYGIPQALPGSKMGKGWQHSPHVQIRWGLGYVHGGRFPNPCAALRFRLANGWY